ncbi:hypothetical protein ARMGADRAFT_1066077 [Armillaria gallica]|uniref:Uncharacterized protein n=1 Tax=Armillaria gallica TaxID=47427 RepID=A0A2H3CW36_ARMGA|nr:hypothetical protein ARMGADRAFT_1066077 [Armillaria gallica]
MTPTSMVTLEDFHEYWWGNDTPLAENTVIHLPAFSDLRILAFSRSWLLVRKDYIYIFERLQRFCQTPRCYNRGIVLDGHSGIGKSVFLFYALIRCLQESRDVIFHFCNRTLMFSKGGVQKIDLNDFPYYSFCSPIWCLIDSYDGERPPEPLVDAYTMFPIVASSRSDEPYSSWATNRIYGPHPRVCNSASIVQILSTFHRSAWENAYIPCSAALMFRRPASYAGGWDTDYLDFRSPLLAQEVWDQLIYLGYEDALACFSPFRLDHATTVASRWLFHVIARKEICQETTQSRPLTPLREMSLAEWTHSRGRRILAGKKRNLKWFRFSNAFLGPENAISKTI